MKKSKFITNCSRCGEFHDMDQFYIIAVDGTISVRLCDKCYMEFRDFLEDYANEDEEIEIINEKSKT